MGVELVMKLVSCGFADAAAVVEPPTLRRPQPANVPLAELAGAGVVGGSIEPDGEHASIEREGRGGHSTATRSRALTLHRREVSRYCDRCRVIAVA